MMQKTQHQVELQPQKEEKPISKKLRKENKSDVDTIKSQSKSIGIGTDTSPSLESNNQEEFMQQEQLLFYEQQLQCLKELPKKDKLQVRNINKLTSLDLICQVEENNPLFEKYVSKMIKSLKR